MLENLKNLEKIIQNCRNWTSRHQWFVKGLIALVVGIYLISQTIEIFLNISLFSLGVILCLYGLSEMSLLPLDKILISISKFFSKRG